MIVALQSSLVMALTNLVGSSAQSTEACFNVSKNTSRGKGSNCVAAFASWSACLFFVLEKLRILNPRKYFPKLHTDAKYFANSGFRALLDLLMWLVINFESDLIDSLRAPSALALRGPKSKPLYSATLLVHPLKSSLTAYFSCVPEGAVKTAEAPAPSLW